MPLSGAAEPKSLESDADGGLVLAGDFTGTLHADALTAASAGGRDVFVVRTTPGDQVRWLHRLGGPRDDYASVAVVAPGGDVLVAGQAEGRCFVARLAAQDGHELWAIRIDGDGESMCRALDVDAQGEVWTTGFFDGTLHGAQSRGLYDFFAARLKGESGDLAFFKAWGGKGKELPRAIKALPSGGALIAGQFGGEVNDFESDVNFGKGPVRSAGDFDAFLFEIDGGGGTRWALSLGDNGDDELNALALGKDGAIYASGHHQPPGDFRGVSPHGLGNFTGLVLRVQPDGAGQWVRLFEGPSSAANFLAFDGDGRLWTAGNFKGELRVGAHLADSAGKTDAFALAFDAGNGATRDVRVWGSPEFDYARGVAAIPGGLAVAGFTYGELQICGKPIGAPGEQTAWVTWQRR